MNSSNGAPSVNWRVSVPDELNTSSTRAPVSFVNAFATSSSANFRSEAAATTGAFASPDRTPAPDLPRGATDVGTGAGAHGERAIGIRRTIR